MNYFRKAYLPKDAPSDPGTYFCVWEVGDTHWHGAAEWNGKKFQEEKNPLLKGLQPTYWLKEIAGMASTRKQARFTNQALGEARDDGSYDNLYG